MSKGKNGPNQQTLFQDPDSVIWQRFSHNQLSQFSADWNNTIAPLLQTNIFKSIKNKSQEKRLTDFTRFKATLKNVCGQTSQRQQISLMVVVKYLEVQDSLKNYFFSFVFSVLTSFQTNKSFDNGDLYEVSFIMTCKSLPKVSRQDRDKAYVSLKWAEIVGRSRRYPV